MSDNPYQAPESEIHLASDLQEGPVLASRWRRLGAAILDSIILMAVIFPIMFITGNFQRAMEQSVSFGEQSIYTALGVVLYFLINGYLLGIRGQSIGKVLLGIQVVSFETNSIISLSRYACLRYLPMTIIGQLPVVGWVPALADVLFIFRKDKRCIHDLIAGTKVIDYRG